jgi:hypothetical protein
MDSRSATRRRTLRGTLWPAIVAALAGVGLLLAFYQVVRGAVDQAALRRQAVALQADALWRCPLAPGQGASPQCPVTLASMPPGRGAVPGRVVLLAAGR